MVLIGYSGHAYVIADTILSNGDLVLGYCAPELNLLNPYALPYLGEESKSILQNKNWIVAIGDNCTREGIYNKFQKIGVFSSVIHRSACVSKSVELEKGVFVSSQATINPLAKIGKGTIVNTGAIVEHECIVGNFVHIAPGAVLAGNVFVGNRSFIGANSVVKQGVKIGTDVIIGAGSVIIRDIPDGKTVVGNPGRLI